MNVEDSAIGNINVEAETPQLAIIKKQEDVSPSFLVFKRAEVTALHFFWVSILRVRNLKHHQGMI
jgi:hypothetical protein